MLQILEPHHPISKVVLALGEMLDRLETSRLLGRSDRMNGLREVSHLHLRPDIRGFGSPLDLEENVAFGYFSDAFVARDRPRICNVEGHSLPNASTEEWSADVPNELERPPRPSRSPEHSSMPGTVADRDLTGPLVRHTVRGEESTTTSSVSHPSLDWGRPDGATLEDAVETGTMRRISRGIRGFAWCGGLVACLTLVSFGCDRKRSDGSGAKASARGQQQAKEEDEFVAGSEADVFTYALESDPESLDPMKISGVPGGRVAYNLFEGLLMPARTTRGADEPGDLVRPGVATSYEVSEDGTTYTFELRKDAKWSNGREVTAQDFIYSWKRTLLPGYPVDYVHLFYVIEGVREYNDEDTPSNWADVGVEAPDDHTIRIQLEHPTPYFPQLVAFYTFFPQPKKVVESHAGEWTKPEHIVTNGAYTLARYEENDELVLEKNAQYWGSDEVAIERARIRIMPDPNALVEAYRNEKLHWTGRSISPRQVPEFRDHPDFRTEQTLGTYYVQVNVTDEEMFLSDPAFARALRLAIDREQLVEEELNGVFEPADSFVPDGVSGYESNVGLETDVEKAKELVQTLDVPSAEALGTVKLLYNEGQLHERVAGALERRWKETLGLKVELVAKPWDKYLESIDVTAYQLVRSGWVGDYNDPMTFLELWTTDNGNNDTGWSNDDYDALIDKARSARGSPDRMKHFQQAENLLMEKGPVIPLFHYVSHELVGATVQGYAPHNRDIHLLKDLSVKGSK